MSRNIAYKRVSTVHQETDRQFHESSIKFDAIYEDKLSGKDSHRPQFQQCLESLRTGDTLHVWEISRMSRNLDDLRKTVYGLLDKGVSVKFHKEGLEFWAGKEDGMKAAMTKLLLSQMGSYAEFERSLIVERVKEGLAVAKARGKKLGGAASRRRLSQEATYSKIVERDSEHKQYLLSWRSRGLTLQQCADRMNEMGIKSPRGSSMTAKAVQRMCIRLGVE